MYNKNPEYYFPIIDHFFNEFDEEIRVSDVGCGDGSFKGLITEGLNGNFLRIDSSFNLLRKAKNNPSGEANGYLVVADAFNLPFRSLVMFSLIHIDSVLHHLIDTYRKKSHPRL
ncbi:hypothetical protein BH23THE1_BH23THE1_26230 [soil metagenome]